MEPKSDARERLLTRLLDAFDGTLPSPDVSLREVAARTGTSHALLRYHFGSLSGVLAAMLTAQRSRDNAALAEVAQDGTFEDLVAAIWRTYSHPDRVSRIRGFFHVVGLAAYGPEDFHEFIDSLNDLTTLLTSLAEREGRTAADARTTATVTIAALRGLLLQEVLTPGATSKNVLKVIARLTR